MRRRDVRKANQRFMWATLAMAVVVLMVVGLFWLWCLPQK